MYASMNLVVSGNALFPVRQKAIIWTNADLLLTIYV